MDRDIVTIALGKIETHVSTHCSDCYITWQIKNIKHVTRAQYVQFVPAICKYRKKKKRNIYSTFQTIKRRIILAIFGILGI